MIDVAYNTKVQYVNENNIKKSADYLFLASSKEKAIEITKVLFNTEFGQYTNYNIGVRVVKPSMEELELINKKIITDFVVIRNEFKLNSYKDFMDAYVDFRGTNFDSDTYTQSFWITFQNFTFKVVYIFGSDTCYIDESEFIYFSSLYNRKYVIRDNGTAILIGS